MIKTTNTMQGMQRCVKRAGQIGCGLFEVIAYAISTALFLLMGIFTLIPSLATICLLHNIQGSNAILTITVLCGVAASSGFFFGVISWNNNDREKQRWLRVASATLPVLCVVILLTTIESFLYYFSAAQLGLKKSQAALLIMSICSLAAFGQYALALYIVYGKIRRGTQKVSSAEAEHGGSKGAVPL